MMMLKKIHNIGEKIVNHLGETKKIIDLWEREC
jgi:hypothetical protein